MHIERIFRFHAFGSLFALERNERLEENVVHQIFSSHNEANVSAISQACVAL